MVWIGHDTKVSLVLKGDGEAESNSCRPAMGLNERLQPFSLAAQSGFQIQPTSPVPSQLDNQNPMPDCRETAPNARC